MSSIADKLKKKYGDPAEEKNNQQEYEKDWVSSSPTPAVSDNERMRNKLYQKYGQPIRVNQSFLNLFATAAQNFIGRTSGTYNSMDYSNSSSVFDSHKKIADDLRSKSWDIRQYIETNKDSLGTDFYNAWDSLLNDVDKAISSNQYAFYRKKKWFDKFESQEHYDVLNMSKDEYIAKLNDIADANSDLDSIFYVSHALVPIDGYGPYATEDEQRKYSEFRSHLENLWEKYGKDKYDTIEDFYYDEFRTNAGGRLYQAAEEKTKGIAYTTKSGQNLTWEMLLNQKNAQEDLANRLDLYSKNSNWDTLSKGIDVSTDPERQNDYDIVFELSRTNVAYDKETALANGTSEEEWNDIDQKRRYIGNKYGVDLYADIYSNVNIFNEIMGMLDDKSWSSSEYSAQRIEDVIGEQTFKNLRHLTKEEQAVLNYIFYTQGRDAALEWHNSRMDIYQARANGALSKEMYDWGKGSWGGLGAFVSPANLASVALSLGSGLEQIGDWITGDTNNLRARASSSIRSGISDNTDWMIGNFDAYDFVYQTTMSGVDSAVASLLPGGTGSVLLGLSAAAQATNDAVDRGLDNKQAFWNGIFAGVFETIFEKWSIGKFKALKDVDAGSFKEIAKNIGKSMLVNASEETLTEIANIAYDTFVNADLSQYETMIRQLEAQGYSTEDATKMAKESLRNQVIESGASGALMGFGFGTIGSAGSATNIVKEARQEAQNTKDVGADIMKVDGGTDALMNLANEVAGVSGSKKLSNQIHKTTNKTTEKNVGKLFNAIQSSNSSMNQADIAKSLESKGISTNKANAIAEALVARYNGNKLSDKQTKLLQSMTFDQKVRDAISDIVANPQSTMGQRNQNVKKFATDIALEMLAKEAGTDLNAIKNATDGNVTTSDEIASESSYEVSEDGKTVNNVTGEEIELNGLVKAEDGTYMIAAKNADAMSSDDVSYKDRNQALVYETFVNLEKYSGKTSDVIAGMSLDSRNELIGLYNPNINKDGGTFVNGVLDAYFYGHQGIDMATASKDSPIYALSPEQRAIAWNTGRADGMKSTTAAQSNVNTVYAEAKKVLDSGKAKKGSYRAILADGIAIEDLNDKQKATYQLADQIAQAVQTKIRVYNGTNKAQGFYNHATDEIWLNLNAANVGREAIMAFTLAHELVHRAKEGSPAKYQAFVDFLMKEYGKQGSNIEAMIAEQIDAAERFNKTVPDSQKVKMTREKALEEVACEACQRMLLDTNAGQKLAEFGAQSKQNKGFLADLKQWISELMAKLRNFFKNVEPDSKAAKEFSKFDANVKQILADMYVDMSMEAGEKLSTIKAAYGAEFAQKFQGLHDISYNLAAVDTHKAKIQKEYSEDSSTDLDTIMKRYDKIIDIWTRLGGELNSKFLADWNSKVGKDRSFTIFKAQAGYKYNVELSSMCKKGVPLFEAIDTIVKKEVMKELEMDVLGKAEKEILYDILKQHHFEIPCAICYVEQARQREGVIIDAFLNGKVETDSKGRTTKVKLGWNQVLDSIEKEMKANGVNYSFEQVSRDIATEKYTPADLNMDSKTNDAFLFALKNVANQEITRYNKAEGKNRKLLTDVTPAAVTECFKGTLPANLKIFKVLFEESSSRFKIQKDLLYSSMATQNLSMAHNKLYGLFNSQGGVSGYKTKQGTTIYWGDILGKSWKPDTLRNEGGVRNQSNSDFQMFTLLDQAQMYLDFTAKGYYLQAYTKVLSELKLFGLSRGKINASLIPKVVVYRNADGSVDVEKTMANAGLDENDNPIYDDIEGINHNEAFMLIEDPEYSKSICGICIGYSDAHINKLLDDNRVQQIIGFHDKTDDGTKRYKGARYAKNYNGLNEAVNKEGKTVHIGFNTYVKRAEKKFQFNADTETYEGTVNYNGKTYTADDIPRLAADLYLEMCAKKEYTPAYKDFAGHTNYYKLLADFGLYDSQGHYAPHRKVVYNMPDTVPYLDANGKKQTMSTYDYIKAELTKELTVRDSIAEALADTSDEGIIPQFKEAVKKSRVENNQEEKSFSLPKGPYSYETLIRKPDIVLTTVDGNVPNNRADVVYQAKKNAAKVGKFNPTDGSVSVHVSDIGEDVILGTKGLEHGLRRLSTSQTDPTWLITLNAGDIIKNAIRINEITPSKKEASGAYVLIGAAQNKAGDLYVVRFVVNKYLNLNELTSLDVLYAIIAKKEDRLRSMRPGFQRPVTDPKISVADLLDIVNQNFPDILPEEVLKHYGYDSRPDGDLGDDALYKLPVGEDTSPRALLANAFEGIVTNDIEKRRLQEYKGNVEMLNAEEQKLRELRAEIKELSFAKGQRDTAKIKELQDEATKTANRISNLDKILLRLEAATPLQNILKREKEMAYKRAEQKSKEALEAYRKAERERDAKWQSEVKEKYQVSKKKAIETRDKREAREKLQNLVLDTVKWITYPSKTDVKCPDILKQPYADFLNSIDLSSQRLANGGDPTKNDLRLTNAMSSLATALDKVMTSQDPTQETTDVLDTGYLDLPANFVEKLRDMTEEVKEMMGSNEYVVNRMPAAEVRKLTQMIRTLNHAIKEVSTLYANLRFANVEALGDSTMSFVDSLGEIEKAGGIKDFVQWDNALPYYAFRRFGEGGESIFEGLMDAQDKLAFLAQKIFDFQEKAWNGKEAKAWSEDSHTIDLPNGETLTLTTADAMSIYCLSRRQHGLQHLLAGGIRVMGIQKGSKKAKDSRSLLTVKDIDTIISSLTDRQKQVADTIQEFMSTVCSEWGNEISMKRFLTKEFNEKFYFPIESNDENLSTKDPAAQQSDLFRLLNISATKPIDPRANNEVIIRNIFDVFSGHASDMARLNSYGMALLDYMKWLNYREKTVNEDGQIKVRGVRKSMGKAFGAAAKSYVLNLVKDVNGRPSDGGLPNFYTRMLKNAKTAMVGNTLRVATLQFTSYPRAALVLSPKNLALGFSKLPQIKKAKKYCGIALWKSFGFYDTNISRSIEEQIKGVKDAKQKLIELSLKGAEWGDAITWGYLWNACEYEVAATKQYKVGTEEFNQAVGKKLREVVYRTQVVDSTLTRSQMMRGKDNKAKELSAFMSEPTLSANILMDAAFQFNAEKRRTGSAKMAWKKTGSYITRAIAVYSIGQLAAALLEGLWDAWRDDDDEEFSEKFWDAFIKNLILDILPFNKIPILSEFAEAALSLLGLGYFSSDDLSSTALSQTVSAAKSWSDVLNGKTSETTYSAIYKTIRAISSFLGVSISGVMREGVDLWNNTAGAYDSTWKIRTWDLSNTELASEALDAIIEGNDRQANSIRAEFSDDDAYQSAMRTAIKDRYTAGEIDYNTAIQYLVKYGGMEEDDAFWRVDEWMYEIETSDDYDKYNEFFTAVETGKNLKAVITKYTDNGVSVETLASQITSHYKPLYIEMSTAEKANIKGYILNAMTVLGKTREEAERTVSKWEFESKYGFAYDDRAEAYKTGKISASELKNILMTVGGKTAEEADLQIQAYDWEEQGYDGVTAAAVRDYNNYCAGYSVPKDVYLHIRSFANNTKNDVDSSGKTINYSAMKKIMAEINSQYRLTSSQKTAIARSLGWSEKNIQKYKLW